MNSYRYSDRSDTLHNDSQVHTIDVGMTMVHTGFWVKMAEPTAKTPTGVPQGDNEDAEEKAPEVFTKQTEYLNSIYKGFVDLAFPMESNLVDQLRAKQVFDSEDEETISVTTSRKAKARKCWLRLNRVPSQQFLLHCVPALEATCSLVVRGKVFHWDGCEDKCLRHLLRRVITLRRFADMFPGTGQCSHEEYGRIIEGSDHDDELWDLVFKVCKKSKDNVDFIHMFTTTLETFKVPVPEDMAALLTSEFPCSCPERGVKRKQKSCKKKRKRLRLEKVSKSTHENAEEEKKTTPALNESLPLLETQEVKSISTPELMSKSPSLAADNANNNGTCNGEAGRESSEREDPVEKSEDCDFESSEQKESFLKQLEEVNEKILKMSTIRTIYYQATGIQAELLALRQPTRSGGGETSWKADLRDQGKIIGLKQCSRKLYQKLKDDYEAAAEFLKETDTVKSDAKHPCKFKSKLMDRREILVRVFKDVGEFYNKSLAVFSQINLECKDLFDSVENAMDGEGQSSDDFSDEFDDESEFAETGFSLFEFDEYEEESDTANHFYWEVDDEDIDNFETYEDNDNTDMYEDEDFDHDDDDRQTDKEDDDIESDAAIDFMGSYDGSADYDSADEPDEEDLFAFQ